MSLQSMAHVNALFQNRVSAGLVVAALLLAQTTQAAGEIFFESSDTLTREVIRVDAWERKSFEYRLDRGARLVFSLRSSRWRRDPIQVWLVDDGNFHQIEAGRSFDYFESASGLAQRRANFVFPVPESGSYHVVLDNSEGSRPRELAVYAYVNQAELSPRERETVALYESFYRDITDLFETDELDIAVARCGTANAYYQGWIVICRELDDFLAARAPDGVRLFVLMHEVAHRFLDVWGYRSTFHRQMQADRFAAALIELTGHHEKGREAADWFASDAGAIEESPDGSSFSMSRNRARRISDWLTDSDDIERWWTSRILLPRMRTEALEGLLGDERVPSRTRGWIESELGDRRQNENVE